MSIPKIFFQTGKIPQEKYVVDMILSKLTDSWTYLHFTDSEIIQFFNDNPVDELPDMVGKFNSLNGAHKADLFRYYFLYINGGFFIDSDAMIYENIEEIIKDYQFVSVNSSCHPGTIFQGVIGSTPKNPIIKKALFDAYQTDPMILSNYYHYWCMQLYHIIHQNNYDFNIKLYRELRTDYFSGDKILDDYNNVIFKHYWNSKIIPVDDTNI